MEKIRQAGLLLPISALKGDYGIGDFGKGGYSLIKNLKENGFKLWQILPLNPLGFGHSPYQPFSSFALDELYLDLDALKKEGLLSSLPKKAPINDKVSYEKAREIKREYAYKAYLKDKNKAKKAMDEFKSNNPWVANYAVFATFKDEDNRSWDHWEKRKQDYVSNPYNLNNKEKGMVNFHVWLQMKLYSQWNSLHEFALSNGIRIIGDIPFYVGFDSCDVWSDQDSFLLDPVTKQPTFIAGVPPDYFSATGQRWGNPIYNWDKFKQNGFSFLINRIALNAKLYDIIRLDHFRAFDTYWKIPSSCPTAIEGNWIEAPGYEFFDKLFASYPNIEIIAEDLGDLRNEVLVLRDHYNLPGMNVIQFTFHDDVLENKSGYNAYNSVVYLGTHDNDTTYSYVASLDEYERNRWLDALSNMGLDRVNYVSSLIKFALRKDAKYVLLMAEDLLNQDSYSRINVPGIVDDRNWTYKLKDNKDLFEALKEYKEELKKDNR